MFVCDAIEASSNNDDLAGPGCRVCGAETKRFVSSGRFKLACSDEHSKLWYDKCKLEIPRTEAQKTRDRLREKVRYVPVQGTVSRSCRKDGCCNIIVHTRGGRGRMPAYCSQDCYPPTRRRRKNSIQCLGCGETFHPRYVSKRGLNNDGRYCSQGCFARSLGEARRIHETEDDARDAQWARSQIKRALKAGVAHEYFTRAEIFERDRLVCGICKESVDADAKWPNVKCATVDHIIPICAGGPHLRSNAQCAHWICNSKKTFLVDPKDLVADDGECPAIEEIANSHASKVRAYSGTAQTS